MARMSCCTVPFRIFTTVEVELATYTFYLEGVLEYLANPVNPFPFSIPRPGSRALNAIGSKAVVT